MQDSNESNEAQNDYYENHTTLESSVPPSTPIYRVFPKPAAFAYPGMHINAPLAAGKAAASSSTNEEYLVPPQTSIVKPMVSFAEDERPVSHDRKRNRRALQDDSAIEEIMSQITMKMTSLSTDSSTHQQDCIVAFLGVLGCSDLEAQFYLESSDWDIQTAVSLYLENNPNSLSTLDILQRNAFRTESEYFYPSHSTSSTNDVSFQLTNRGVMDNKFLWRDRAVDIVGLDPTWEARVNPYDGHIFFRSKITGITQKQVPPGFADLQDELMQASVHSSPLLPQEQAQLMDENDQENDNDAMSSSQSLSTNYTNVAVSSLAGGGNSVNTGVNTTDKNTPLSGYHINNNNRHGARSISPQSGASVYSENSCDPSVLTMHSHVYALPVPPSVSFNDTNGNINNSTNNMNGNNNGYYPESESSVSITHDQHRLAQAVEANHNNHNNHTYPSYYHPQQGDNFMNDTLDDEEL